MLDITNNQQSQYSFPFEDKVWTDERIRLLRQYFEEDVSYGNMVRLLGGPSRNAIISKAQRLGLFRGRYRGVDPNRTAGVRAPRERRVKSRHTTLSRNHHLLDIEYVHVEEAPQPSNFLGVSLLDLQDGQCRFPRGEGRDITFCGQPVLDNTVTDPRGSYCAHCHAISYPKRIQRDARREERKRQEREIADRLQRAMMDAAL